MLPSSDLFTVDPLPLEHLSDASFLGKLLVFQANVRVDWKVIASTNTLGYLASSTVMKVKCFITLTPDDFFPVVYLDLTEDISGGYCVSLVLVPLDDRALGHGR
jgi:hypothetical protein